MRAPLSLPDIEALSRPPGVTPVVFNDLSLQRLETVNPQLRGLLMETERRADQLGIDFEISEGGDRSIEQQRRNVAAGVSQTMNSQHLDGDAADIMVLQNGNVTWDFPRYQEVADIAHQVAAEQGVGNFVWGGDWTSFRDGPHFQVNTGNNAPAPYGHAGHAAPVMASNSGNALSGGGGAPVAVGNAGTDTLGAPGNALAGGPTLTPEMLNTLMQTQRPQLQWQSPQSAFPMMQTGNALAINPVFGGR